MSDFRSMMGLAVQTVSAPNKTAKPAGLKNAAPEDGVGFGFEAMMAGIVGLVPPQVTPAQQASPALSSKGESASQANLSFLGTVPVALSFDAPNLTQAPLGQPNSLVPSQPSLPPVQTSGVIPSATNSASVTTSAATLLGASVSTTLSNEIVLQHDGTTDPAGVLANSPTAMANFVPAVGSPIDPTALLSGAKTTELGPPMAAASVPSLSIAPMSKEALPTPAQSVVQNLDASGLAPNGLVPSGQINSQSSGAPKPTSLSGADQSLLQSQTGLAPKPVAAANVMIGVAQSQAHNSTSVAVNEISSDKMGVVTSETAVSGTITASTQSGSHLSANPVRLAEGPTGQQAFSSQNPSFAGKQGQSEQLVGTRSFVEANANTTSLTNPSPNASASANASVVSSATTQPAPSVIGQVNALNTPTVSVAPTAISAGQKPIATDGDAESEPLVFAFSLTNKGMGQTLFAPSAANTNAFATDPNPVASNAKIVPVELAKDMIDADASLQGTIPSVDGSAFMDLLGGGEIVTTAQTDTPQRPAQTLPAHTLPMMAATMMRRLENGVKQFSMRLDPPELGQVEVKLSVEANKKTRAVISVDRPEALADLSKSARDLVQALRDAGLDIDDNGLSFNLNDRSSQQHQQANDQRQTTRTFLGDDLGTDVPAAALPKSAAPTQHGEFQTWQRARVALTI